MDADAVFERVMWFIPVLLSLTVHEWAHAWAAWKLGDDTAKHLGRLTLNPLAHMDPVGTFLLPLLGVPFAWAKPVPVALVRFNRGVSMRMGILLVAAAGPISNALLAPVAYGLSKLLRESRLADSYEILQPVQVLLEMLVSVNIVLCVFNLIPIPPLDGSKILDGLVPDSLRPAWNRCCEAGPALLIALFLLPVLIAGISPASQAIEYLMRLVEGR